MLVFVTKQMVLCEWNQVGCLMSVSCFTSEAVLQIRQSSFPWHSSCSSRRCFPMAECFGVLINALIELTANVADTICIAHSPPNEQCLLLFYLYFPFQFLFQKLLWLNKCRLALFLFLVVLCHRLKLIKTLTLFYLR